MARWQCWWAALAVALWTLGPCGAEAAAVPRDPARAEQSREALNAPDPGEGVLPARVVPTVVQEVRVRTEQAPALEGEIVVLETPRPKSPVWPGGGRRGLGAPDSARGAALPTEAQGERSADSGFFGSDYDNNIALSGGFAFIPPDSHVAVGPGHVLTVSNVVLQAHSKSATPTRVVNQLLRSFFAPLGVPSGNYTFDPKVLYDPYADRFLVLTLEVNDPPGAAAGASSRLLLAASAGSDPTLGTWRMTAINARLTSGGVERWADFPGFAVDEEAIYVSANLFAFDENGGSYGGVRIWVVPKAAFYAGTSFTTRVLDPYQGLTPGPVTTLATRVVGNVPGAATGTWFVAAGYGSGANELLRVLRLDHPLGTTPSVNSQFINLGDVDNAAAGAIPGASQPGTSTTLDAGDRRASDAMWREGRLWLTHTVNPPGGVDAGQATVRWVEIDTANLAALGLANQGAIGAESLAAQTHTYYGNVAVTPGNRAVIGFSASSANGSLYPGAYYVIRTPSHAAGATGPVQTLRAGVDQYVRTFGGGNRWGDYSGAAVDESTGCAWVFNQYAQTRAPSGTERGRWGTYGGRVCTRATTSLSLGPITPSPSVTGQPVSVGFTLSESDPATPSGTVTVQASSGETCTATLPGSSCTLVFSTAGSRELTATYSGDAQFASSSSAPVAHGVQRANTVLNLNAPSPNPSRVGQSVTLSWTLQVASPGAGAPSGTVTVGASSGESCSATLPSGSCSLTFLTAGTRTLSANYPGDAHYTASSSASRTQSVERADTNTQISAVSSDPATSGVPITVSWSVSPQAPGGGTPGGTVTVTAVGGSESCTATLPSAGCSLTLIGIGPRTLIAQYGGSPHHNGSQGTRPITVARRPTSTTITLDQPDPSQVGQSYLVTVSVGAAVGTPIGQVGISDGAGASCQASLHQGSGSCSLTSLTPGLLTLTASYPATDVYAASSDTEPHLVQPGPDLLFRDGFEQ